MSLTWDPLRASKRHSWRELDWSASVLLILPWVEVDSLVGIRRKGENVENQQEGDDDTLAGDGHCRLVVNWEVSWRRDCTADLAL